MRKSWTRCQIAPGTVELRRHATDAVRTSKVNTRRWTALLMTTLVSWIKWAGVHRCDVILQYLVALWPSGSPPVLQMQRTYKTVRFDTAVASSLVYSNVADFSDVNAQATKNDGSSSSNNSPFAHKAETQIYVCIKPQTKYGFYNEEHSRSKLYSATARNAATILTNITPSVILHDSYFAC